MIYRFDDIEIDTDRFELRQGGVARKVEPQVFSLIELLVANHGRMVSKDELNARIWGGRVVSDAVVNSRIRSARQAIGDDGKAQRLIQTVRNRGFRFAAEPVAENRLPAGYFAPVDGPDPGVKGEETAATASPPSIAVLPFQLLSAEPRYETFADALAHEVIVELSRMHWLFVIARGSSFRFRGGDADLHEAGKILAVRYLLTGSVAIDGGRSIVTAELSQADSGMVLWADRFEGKLGDLLELRLTIAARIVTAIEVRIPMSEAIAAVSLPTENLDSWSAYHRGLWHMYRFNSHDNEIAARMFCRAIECDPNFARAHAGLSFTHFQNAFVGYSKDAESERNLARSHAERSLDLDPLDPFANLSVARADWLAGDLEKAVPWFDRSVELNPNYALALYNRALLDAITGAGDESERRVIKAISLSPIDPLHYAMLATRALSYIARADYAAAGVWAERAANAPNAHVHIRIIAALAHALAGDRAAAERWASEVRRGDPRYDKSRFFKAFPFTDEGTLAKAKAALKRLGL